MTDLALAFMIGVCVTALPSIWALSKASDALKVASKEMQEAALLVGKLQAQNEWLRREKGKIDVKV